MSFAKGAKNKILSSIVCVICSISLTTASFAEVKSGAASKTPFVPPLVLSDYNNGILINNLEGLSGGDETAPGTTYTTIIADEGFTRGNSGYSLKLDFDVSNLGEYSFYWIKLGKEIPGRKDVTYPLDLRKYSYLSFYIKGSEEGGNVKIEMHQDVDDNGIFTFGRDISSSVYAASYLKTGTINRNWQKVLIPLKDFNKITDWSKTSELVLVFENRSGNKAGTVYIDDILFGYRPEDAFLPEEELAPIKAPIESSFTINGMAAKQCPAFSSVNVLEIKAEDLAENPLIESVGFEVSTDKGSTWKAIGNDYIVNKKKYKVEWQPDNTRQNHNYDVRAIATDIYGNEAPTGILISCGVKPITDDEFLDLIERKAFNFFRDHQDPKTGLFADTSGGGDASIASTGFGLAALCIGAERGWIDKKEAARRVGMALDSFIPKSGQEEALVEGKYGFFYHFVSMHTGKRSGKCEISTVDTAILVAGAITAGEYFGSAIKDKADAVYGRVEWDKFLSQKEGPYFNLFSMGWSPERGFLESYWDYYTDEIVLLSLLAIGSPTNTISPDVFYAWIRQSAAYEGGGKPFIYSWHGALFSYQYANIWFDFRDMADKKGVNWFENSTNATLANRQFCIDNADKFKGYGPNSWGITSMARPSAYTMHFGPPPTGNGEPQYDGTISPTGPAGSIVFTPYLSVSALKYMYITYPRLWGQYGFKDSFNLDINWYSSTYYGIGVTMMLLPIENFRTGLIWKNFMKNKYVQSALSKAGFTRTKERPRK